MSNVEGCELLDLVCEFWMFNDMFGHVLGAAVVRYGSVLLSTHVSESVFCTWIVIVCVGECVMDHQ